MVKPERRTKADLIAAAAIVVVVAVGAAMIWWHSDARATVSRPADHPIPALHAAKTVPTTLREMWTAASSKTTQPAVVGGVVVTGDHEVTIELSEADGTFLAVLALPIAAPRWIQIARGEKSSDRSKNVP